MLLRDREDILVDEANSPQTALKQVRSQKYDLVLLDLKMPSGTEGLDVLRKIKKLKPAVQVIMMSGYGDIATAVQAIQLGALDFLPKGDALEDVKSLEESSIIFKLNESIKRLHWIADRERLIQTKYHEVRTAKNAQNKGKALEELVSALFSSIDGFLCIDCDLNTETEEIDLIYRNCSREPVWKGERNIILVECKNWISQRVGKNEFVLFREKMQNRVGRCTLGFLVCVEKFASTITKEMLRGSKRKHLVVPIDGDKLRQLVETEDRSNLLRSFVDQALMI